MEKMNLKQQYQAIHDALRELEITDHSPSEIHGLMAGYLTDQPAHKTYEAWAEDILNEPLDVKLLQHLFAVTKDQLADTEFGLQLLIPDDEAPMQERAVALSEWSEAYISGFGHNNVQVTEEQNVTLSEGLESLVEVAKLDYLSLTGSDEEENLLTEVEEFVRATVMLFVEELSVRQDGQVAGTRTLH